MKIIETIEREFDKCDFCDTIDYSGYDVISCDICEKDICRDHRTSIELTPIVNLYICPDCVKKDFTQIIQIAEKRAKLYEEYLKLDDQIDALVKNLK